MIVAMAKELELINDDLLRHLDNDDQIIFFHEQIWPLMAIMSQSERLSLIERSIHKTLTYKTFSEFGFTKIALKKDFLYRPEELDYEFPLESMAFGIIQLSKPAK